MAFDYVIIGSGIAGVTAAKDIRKKDKDGSILIVGDDRRNPYYRIKLSELLGEEDPALPALAEEGWNDKLGIQCKLGVSVESVNFEKRILNLSDGEKVEAKKILLANGSHANLPPFENRDLKGVFTLRSYDDLLSIGSYLKNAKRVGVIGGGLLGLEAAKSLQNKGHDVVIVDMEEYLLSKQLDRELGMMLNEEMKDHGFMVYTSKATKGFVGEDRVTGIEFDDGTVVDLDCVLVSIGVRSNIDLFKGTELNVNRGVVVDRELKTNIENVWAAGDVAEIDGRTMGIWPASRAMGKVAAENMTGGKATYENPKLFTKLDIDEIQVFSCGDISEGDVYFYDDGDVHHRLFAKDGKVTGVILYHDTKAMTTYRKLVENHADIEEALEAKYSFTTEKA